MRFIWPGWVLAWFAVFGPDVCSSFPLQGNAQLGNLVSISVLCADRHSSAPY
jgi:hypothetical protein